MRVGIKRVVSKAAASDAGIPPEDPATHDLEISLAIIGGLFSRSAARLVARRVFRMLVSQNRSSFHEIDRSVSTEST